MDFFEHQATARRNTVRLVILFAFAVAAIVAAIYGGLVLATNVAGLDGARLGGAGVEWWRPQLLVLVAAGVLLVVSVGTTFKVLSLASGGGVTVAESLGATPVDPGTRDLQERRLLNVVEEMALASGIPVPTVYIMRDEDHINAFAAGTTLDDAVVAVTRGALDQLNREELQGVVAHEFSHVLHGDMRLNLRLMGVLHGILLLGLLGRIMLRGSTYGRGFGRDSRGNGAGALILIALVLLVVGYIGVFFAGLIKAGVSRQREYLADASAVQFTRNPPGIAGALKKIGGFADGGELRTVHAEEASHMFIAQALRGTFLGLTSTHPPLLERIRRLDPGFRGDYPAPSVVTPASSEAPPEAAVMGLGNARAGTGGHPVALDPAAVVASAGVVTRQHLDHAGRLLQRLPAGIAAAVREPFGARAVVYGLLLTDDSRFRHQQVADLHDYADAQVVEQMSRLLPELRTLPRDQYLPVVSLAIGALRRLSNQQYQVFRDNVVRLVRADQRVDLFEYALHRMLLRHLAPVFGDRRPAPVAYHRLERLAQPCAVFLSALAWAGQDNRVAAERAYAAGMERLDLAAKPSLLDRPAAGLKALDQALAKLEAAAPPLRRQLVAAATACIASDSRVTVDEAELLRAVVDALDCPLPPLLAEPGA